MILLPLLLLCTTPAIPTRPPPHVASKPATPIPRLSQKPDRYSPAWFSPFILRANTSQWYSLRTWNVSFFAHHFGTYPNLVVPVSKINTTDAATGIVPYDYHTTHQVWLPFKEACAKLVPNQSDPTSIYYMNQFPLEEILRHAAIDDDAATTNTTTPKPDFRQGYHFHPLRTTDQFRVPFALPKFIDSYSNVFLWLGSPGTRSGLHFDLPDNFHAMVDGNKTVVLFPPEDSAYLYPYPDIPTKSQLDPLRTDWSTSFPNLDKTHPMYAYLTPGDLLYLPKLWWHWLDLGVV